MSNRSSSLWRDWAGCGLALLLIAIFLWRAPLTASLWTDELVTAWVIGDGAAPATARAIQFQGQSPLYFWLLALVAEAFGRSEFVLRMPSLLAWLGCLLLTYQVARTLLGRQCALFALLAFIGCDTVQVAALSARPYCFALFLALVSMHYFIRWCAAHAVVDQIACLLAAVLAFYLHYLYGLVVLLQLLYLLLPDAELRRPRVTRIAFGYAAFLLACVPGLIQLRALSARAGELSFAARPVFADLVEALFPFYLNVCVLTAVLAAAAFFGTRIDLAYLKQRPHAVKLTALWAILPPALFFVFSSASANSLFIERYFAWHAAGVAMLCACIPALLADARARRAALGVFALLLFMREVAKQFQIEQWREAVAQARTYAAQKEPTILFNPGLVETRQPAALEIDSRRNYLLSLFDYYPLAGEKVLLPLGIGHPEFEAYISRVVAARFSEDELLLICPKRSVRNSATHELVRIDHYYQKMLEQAGYKAETKDLGGVAVLRFYR